MLHISMHTHMSLTLCLRACSLLCIRTDNCKRADLEAHLPGAHLVLFHLRRVYGCVRLLALCMVIVQQSLLERFMAYRSAFISIHGRCEARPNRWFCIMGQLIFLLLASQAAYSLPTGRTTRCAPDQQDTPVTAVCVLAHGGAKIGMVHAHCPWL